MAKIKICFEYYQKDGDIEFLNNHAVKNVDGVCLITVELNLKEGDATTDETKEAVTEFAKQFITTIFADTEFIKTKYPTVYKKSMTCQYWFHVFEEDFIKLTQKEFEAESFDEEVDIDKILNEIEEDVKDTPMKINMIDIVLSKDLEVLENQPEPINYWDTI